MEPKNEERMRDLLQAGVLLIDSMLADHRDWQARLEAWTLQVAELGGRPRYLEPDVDVALESLRRLGWVTFDEVTERYHLAPEREDGWHPLPMCGGLVGFVAGRPVRVSDGGRPGKARAPEEEIITDLMRVGWDVTLGPWEDRGVHDHQAEVVTAVRTDGDEY